MEINEALQESFPFVMPYNKNKRRKMKRTSFVVALVIFTVSVVTACGTSSVPQDESVVLPTTDPDFVKLNLNTVSGDELLAAIPGFSNRMVREFQEYKPYVSIQQFRREIGKYVSDEQVAQYENYVFVPIAINDSDSETLQQLPGLDATEAESLMASRPYATNDEFLAALTPFVTADELEIAITYLE